MKKIETPAWENQNSFSLDDLLACANGKLFTSESPKLPLPPMLMVNGISDIRSNKGKYNTGYLKAYLEIHSTDWFFKCHFKSDPVMPGCLGLDALWQLTGFYLGYLGYQGKGRALGLQDMKFEGQVLPNVKYIYYQLDFKRIIARKEFVMGIADGSVFLDSDMKNMVYKAVGLRVGLFEK